MNSISKIKRFLLFFLIFIFTAVISYSLGTFSGRREGPVLSPVKVTQVAIVVKDIDKARRAWAEVFGTKVSDISITESNPLRPTLYRSEATEAKAKLSFIQMENLQIELIQPLGGKSTWQEFLDNHGEGIHHIAFEVKGIHVMEGRFAQIGMPTLQSGGWDGGAYSYVDGSDKLGCILELLEFHGKE